MRAIVTTLLIASVVALAAQQNTERRGQRLDPLTWNAAEELLTQQSVVVIPIAGASLEHGLHLPLDTDAVIADELANRLVRSRAIVVAPVVTYTHAPALAGYPGSSGVTLATARDTVADVARSFARSGPRRYYALSTSLSGAAALRAAAEVLRTEGILLRYAQYDQLLDRASRGLRDQNVVGHADDVETSMMLAAKPASVTMANAVRDFAPANALGTLARQQATNAILSPSGTWGDPTKATAAKGQAILEALTGAIAQEIDALQQTEPPAASAATAVSSQTSTSRIATAQAPPEACTPGDERTIRGIGDAFTTAWLQADAVRLGSLWSVSGNIVHPDGLVERGSDAIIQARAELFTRRQYRNSRHPLTLTMVRCLANDVAVADGSWELRGLTSSDGGPVAPIQGLCTMVVRRNGGTWQIEAYRYSIKTPTTPVPPNVLSRPGYPGSGRGGA
jgi:creatinine amidohydrolase